MKTGFGRLAVVFGALAVALSFGPNCAAQCGGVNRARPAKSSWLSKSGLRLLPAAYQAADEQDWRHDKSTIVGFWHVKFVSEGSEGIPDGTEVDAGYSQWHSDGTEIMNSGGRAPDTGDFCLGVWEQVGRFEYRLNHLAAAWDPAANQLIGPANIREDVKLSENGKNFSGTFTIVQYDEQLGVKAQVKGTITGTRIEVNTKPESVF